MFYLHAILFIRYFFEINQEIYVVAIIFCPVMIQNKEPDDVSLAPCSMCVEMIMLF